MTLLAQTYLIHSGDQSHTAQEIRAFYGLKWNESFFAFECNRCTGTFHELEASCLNSQHCVHCASYMMEVHAQLVFETTESLPRGPLSVANIVNWFDARSRETYDRLERNYGDNALKDWVEFNPNPYVSEAFEEEVTLGDRDLRSFCINHIFTFGSEGEMR